MVSMKWSMTMDLLNNDYPARLLEDHEPPCISVYQPTHRYSPDNLQDPIRFRNLLKTVEEALRQVYPKSEAKALLEPFQALAADGEFWSHTLDGLAVLGAPGIFRAYRLQRPVPEFVAVTDSFHLKPLIRALQSADRYQILALNRQRIRLFEGNRYVLDELRPAPGVPLTITDALGEELTEPYKTVAGRGAAGSAVHHGQGSKKDEQEVDTERFFRAVDRAILEHHSRPSALPLLLAALTEYHTLFRGISQNPFLSAEGLDVNPDALTIDQLRERAWPVVEGHYLARLARLVEDFGAARPNGLAADDLTQIAKAGTEGRIAALLIEADRQIPGLIKPADGEIELAASRQPNVDDILDDLGELVLKRGGQVVIVPADKMPTQTGAAAIYRF